MVCCCGFGFCLAYILLITIELACDLDALFVLSVYMCLVFCLIDCLFLQLADSWVLLF